MYITRPWPHRNISTHCRWAWPDPATPNPVRCRREDRLPATPGRRSPRSRDTASASVESPGSARCGPQSHRSPGLVAGTAGIEQYVTEPSTEPLPERSSIETRRRLIINRGGMERCTSAAQVGRDYPGLENLGRVERSRPGTLSRLRHRADF